MHESAALIESRRFGARSVPLLRPLGWLAAGWHDFMRQPLPGLLHGLALAAFGALLFTIARDQFWWLAGAFSGFMLVAPILATGLYALSRAMQRGDPAGLATALAAWKPRDARLVTFGLLLSLAGTGWVLTSAALITAFAGAPVAGPADFIRVVVLAPTGHLFELWLALGGVLGAVFTSWRCVMENPAPLALWAGLIMLLTAAGMASLMLGLMIVVPWLAHASWHAYRDLVDASGLQENE